MKPDNLSIDELAAAWVVRLDAEKSEAADREFRAWVESDPAHAVSFARAKGMWLMLDGCGREAPKDILWPDQDGPYRFITRRNVLSGVAAVTVVGAAALLLPTSTRAMQLTTGTGQIAAYRLADGTLLDLDTETKAELLIERDQYLLRLHSGGVWLRVAASQIPFITESDHLRLRTREADFSLHVDLDDRVLVSTGALDLSAVRGDALEVRLGPGAEAVQKSGQPIQLKMLPVAEIQRRLAWREGRIELNGEQLAEAVKMFNRYNRYQVVVADPELARQTLVGRFSATEPRRFAAAVATAFDAKVVFEPDMATLTLN